MGGGKPERIALAALLGAAAIMSALLVIQFVNLGPNSLTRALTDPDIRHAIFLSLGTSTAASILALGLGLPAAYALARRDFPGKSLLDLLIDLPIVLSPVAVGVCLLLIFRTPVGRWIDNNLVAFVFEVPGIILAQFIVSLSLSIRVMKASFEDVDVRLEQVARFLGSTPSEVLRRVTLPLASRGILAAFILAWARSMGEFGATVTIAGAVAGKTETMPSAIHNRLSAVDIDGAVSLIAILTVISLLALLGVRLAGRRR